MASGQDISRDKELILAIWNKASVAEGFNPERFRRDPAGAWIAYDNFGLDSELGWSVDHIFPASKGGDDNIANLRPMHWRNTESKGDDFPIYHSVVSGTDVGNNKDLNAERTINSKTMRELIKIYPFITVHLKDGK